MYLKDLIAWLEQHDPATPVDHGFGSPHSYRGDYCDLAFEPCDNTTVGQMIQSAQSAVGQAYGGWKGGEFTMDEWSQCWLAEHGCTGDMISPYMLQAMVTTPAKLLALRAEVDRLSQYKVAVEAAKVLSLIADAYDDNALDDEARKWWGADDEYTNETPHHLITLYEGRGGRTLLTLADCMRAREVLLQINDGQPSSDYLREALDREPFSTMFSALCAQELASLMQSEGMPDPNDPRYTPYIGKWNGYHAPEQRYGQFMHERRELRTRALSQAAALVTGEPAEVVGS